MDNTIVKMNIQLRKPVLEDAEALAAMCTRIDKSYMWDDGYFPATKEKAEFWIRAFMDEEDQTSVCRIIIIDETISGYITVERGIRVHKRDSSIGYVLLTEHWNKGIMTWATKEICRIAFEELLIVRITGICFEENIASRRVLEKAGFQQEGYTRKAIIKDEDYYNIFQYGLLKDDYMAFKDH